MGVTLCRTSFSPLCVKRTPNRYGASSDGTSPVGVVTIASPSLSANEVVMTYLPLNIRQTLLASGANR